MVALAGALYGAAVFVSVPEVPPAELIGSYMTVGVQPLQVAEVPPVETIAEVSITEPVTPVPEVPFYSQFTDITAPEWKKVSCGIASVAMVIDYYSELTPVPDVLLAKGIAAGSFLSDAGWTHAGLIDLARPYGLAGSSVSLAGLSVAEAFASFADVVREGPVLASVHYTFEPTNPIPHLVVVTAVQDGLVYYNDPAEPTGGGSLTVDKFKRAWKQRYIEIRPIG